MSKRSRGDDAPEVGDPTMLREAQHKAMCITLNRYKLSITELEAKLSSATSTSTALTDVLSVLGRQLAAVRIMCAAHPPPPKNARAALPPPSPPPLAVC